MNKTLLLLGLVLCTSMLYAQITIGSAAPPTKGALLDLKTDSEEGANSTKGLLLPRVQLESRTKLLPTAGDKFDEHIGLTVYNIGPAPECIFSSVSAGVYVWGGQAWTALGTNSADPGIAANAQIYKTTLNGEILTGQAVTLTVGSSVRFVGHANGDDLSYVWYKEGTTPPTAKNSDGAVLLANLQLGDRGVYHCRIYDSCDEYVTRSITVNVEPVTCVPITLGSIKVSGVANAPVAPNTYDIDLWNLEEIGENTNVKDIYINLLPDNSTTAGTTVDWVLDGVAQSKKYMSLSLEPGDLKIGQSILTYTAKQSGCADQSGVIVLNLGYNCSRQNVRSYVVYDKAANPENPTYPTMHLNIYNSIERVVSPTGDVTYKVAVNKDKLAADRMIYIPFYKDFFMDDVVHTNEQAYDGVRELLNVPFAPQGGLKLEVPPAGTTWTTVEKFYDKKTQCAYVATYEVKIADSDCELVSYAGFTTSMSNDPLDPFMEVLPHILEGENVIELELEKELMEVVIANYASIFVTISVGDMSKVELITVDHPSFASYIFHGGGLYELKFSSIAGGGGSILYFDFNVKTTDSSCPLIKKKLVIKVKRKNPDSRTTD